MATPLTHNFARRRGDTFPVQTAIKDAALVAVDITGHTFSLVVDPSATPFDATRNLFSVAGTIIDALLGRVDFAISTANANLAPGIYHYEIQMTDSGGLITTILAGHWTVDQDIVK